MYSVTSREVALAVAGGVLLGSAFLLIRTGPRLTTGSRSPALSVPLVANGTGSVSLTSAGRVTVVDFFASWCGVCAASVPRLERTMTRDGVRFIAVSADDSVDAARAVAARWNLVGPVAWDRNRRALDAYGVRALPTLIVSRPDGTIAATHVGPVSPSTLRAEVERARARRASSPGPAARRAADR
jgi:thiol-disulfide isomerase/thioredoxin